MIELKEQPTAIEVKKRTSLLSMFHANAANLNWLIILIPLLYMFVITFLPLFSLFKQSFFDEGGFTLEYLTQVTTNPLYLKVLLLTIKIALLVTFFSLIIAYPIAFFIVRTDSAIWKKVVLSVVLIPFWISLLVRTFSWNILLQDQGVINKLLMKMGLISEPLTLLYNTTGVVIGMTHVLLPYMVLSLYSVMQGIDQRLLQAAEGLGAKPFKAFVQIFLPLSVPGIVSGSLLVFVLSLGFYITPALLGGANNMMIAMLIENNIVTTLNWNLAAALSLLLFFVTVILILVPYLIFKNHAAVKGVI